MPSSVNTLNLVFIEKTHLFFLIIISVLLTSNSDEQDVEVKDLDEILESWFTKTKCFPPTFLCRNKFKSDHNFIGAIRSIQTILFLQWSYFNDKWGIWMTHIFDS